MNDDSTYEQPSLEEVTGLLSSATDARKCHSCGCFHDTVAAISASPLAEPMAHVLDEARSKLRDRKYDCLGCEVCWPAEALDIAGQLVELPAGAGCPTEVPEVRSGWPPYPGDYEVQRYTAPVAVCTLHSRELLEAVAAAAPEGVAVVGALQTENLGIERVIENIVTNPHIRTLLLCGEDTAGRIGHFPGQSLIALVENGINERGRIIGADGRRPLLHNVDRALVEHFRAQVTVIDHRGLVAVPAIVEASQRAAEASPGPYGVALPDAAAPVEVVAARAPGKLVLDPAGYIVIFPDRRRGVLLAEHYENIGVLHTVVEGTNAIDIMATLLAEGLVTRADHAAYLGRELALAESALHDGTSYVQDRAPEAEEEPVSSCGCSSKEGSCR